MPLLDDVASDALIQSVIDRCDRIYLCTAEPTTYAEASATFRMGVKAGPVFGLVEAHSPDGRHSYIDFFSDGVIELSDTATHYALVDDANQVLLAVQAATAPAAGAPPDTWQMSGVAIIVREPT